MLFKNLGLAPQILSAVLAKGYTTPTPIQKQAIPYIMEGRDLEGLAQTGTGKTAAFVLPMLHRLITNESKKVTKNPRALILVPTRELAQQVIENTREYGKNSQLKSLAVYGGVSLSPQIQALRRGVDILVATPGRLLDHLVNNNVNLSQVEVLVLDEADRMFDMGFIVDIQKIITKLPAKRQNLIFSATFAPEVRTLAHKILNNPALVEVAARNATATDVEQKVIFCNSGTKKELLIHLLHNAGFQQTLIFCRTKHGADSLTKALNEADIGAMAIHSNKSQATRTQTLKQFKDGKVEILVGTDIASRGLDITALPVVINYELPHIPEDYIHRIGRTGRAGAKGLAISLVANEEKSRLREIERLLKKTLFSEVVEGFEPKKQIKSSFNDEKRPNSRPAGRSSGPNNRGKSGDFKSSRPSNNSNKRPTRDKRESGENKYNDRNNKSDWKKSPAKSENRDSKFSSRGEVRGNVGESRAPKKWVETRPSGQDRKVGEGRKSTAGRPSAGGRKVSDGRRPSAGRSFSSNRTRG